jgi:TonB family protein
VQLVQAAQALFERRNYKGALAACDQALTLDPSNRDAQQLRSRIRQTMQVLGIDPQAKTDTSGKDDPVAILDDPFSNLPNAGSSPIGGGPFHIGNGVSAPQPIYKPEPEYSEVARKAKLQGKVLLSIVVDVDGKSKDILVVRPLGMGLDEKAIEAVAKWRFRPGYKDGQRVQVKANIEVNFVLL